MQISRRSPDTEEEMHKKNQSRPASFTGNPIFLKDLVRDLDPEVRRDVSAIFRERTVEAGSILLANGEPALDIFLLRSGTALLVVETVEGGGLTREIAPGEIVGLPEAVEGTVYDITVVTRSRCRFRSAAGTDLSRVLHRHHSLCFRLVTLLAANLNKGRQIFASSII